MIINPVTMITLDINSEIYHGKHIHAAGMENSSKGIFL